MKFPTKLAVFGLLVVVVGGYFHSRASRYNCIIHSTVALNSCARELGIGVCTNGDGSIRQKIKWCSYTYTDIKKRFTIKGEVSAYTNTVVIADTSYQCDWAFSSPEFGHAGVLAMTTNKIYIWLDKSGRAKVIDEHYSPPFSPWRF